MLKITVPQSELFNEQTNEVYHVKEQTLTLEHSLLSISKWESKMHKPFFNRKKEEQTMEEQVCYLRCATIGTPLDDSAYYAILYNQALATKIDEYFKDPMTATTFGNNDTRRNNSRSRRKMTSEEVYYYMVAYNIPFECEKWHINRLMTLIHVCEAKNSKEKMSKRSIYAQNRELNAARRAKLHSKG